MWRPSKKVVRPVLLVLTVLVLLGLVRANVPVDAFRREIVVEVPRQVAWDHFAKVREWPSWLGAATAITHEPGDVIGPDSVATIGAGNMATTFRMAEFEPPSHWMWTSRVGWLTLLYDHRFEQITDTRTRLTFHMRITGFGKHVLAALIGRATAGQHAIALPKLANEMNALASSRPPAP